MNTDIRGKGFGRLSKYMRPYRLEFIFIILVIVFLIFSEIANGWFFKAFFDNIVAMNLRKVYIVFIIGLVINLFMSICYYLRMVLITNFSEKIGIDLKKQLFEHIAKLPISYFNKSHSGDLISRLLNDTNEAKNGISSNLVQLIYGPLLSISVLIYMFIVNWKLAIVCASISPLTFITGKILGKLISINSKKLQETLGEVSSYCQDIINGITEIKCYKVEKVFISKFCAIADESLNCATMNNKLKSRMNGISNFVGFLAYAVVWGVGGYLSVKKQMSVGDLLVFTRLLDRLINPFSAFMNSWASFKHSISAADRVFEVLDIEPESAVQIEKKGKDILEKYDIEIKNLHFGYDGNEVFKDFSLKIREKEKFAIVGPSGSGKSTLLKLFLRLYELDDSYIKIGGLPIRNIDRKVLASLISYIPQSGFIFKGSIKDNIIFGREDISDEDVINASKIANAHHFISKFDRGYDTDVGEHGSKLSDGQKQRIIIARAIIKNAPILLMDEATSSLDSESESLIAEAMKTVIRDRTTIIVAHKLLTISDCDKIGVIKEGNLIEKGTHKELMELDGYYKKLYELQF